MPQRNEITKAPILPLRARVELQFGNKLLVRVPALDGSRERKCERRCSTHWAAWDVALTAAVRAGYRVGVDSVRARGVRIIPADLRKAAIAALAAVAQAEGAQEDWPLERTRRKPPAFAAALVERVERAGSTGGVEWCTSTDGGVTVVRRNGLPARELVLKVYPSGPRLFALREEAHYASTGLLHREAALDRLVAWLEGRTEDLSVEGLFVMGLP